MRWLFLFVFSLNLAYIAWEISRSPSVDYADVPALKNVQPIVLLSEVKQQKSEPVRAEQVKEGAVIAENATADSLAEKLEEAGSLAANSQQGTDKAEQVAPEVIEQTPPAEDSKAGVAVVQKVPEKKVATAALAQDSGCYTLGPFRDLDKLRGLTREIKSYVVATDFRGREEREQTLYWVFIKPEKSHSKAVATGKRLKAKKIRDFYVISDGEKINGLSLGRFRNKAGAYGLAKKVRNLGFDVIVEPVFKTYTIYWLDYQLASGAKIPQSIFNKYVKQSKKDNISRLSRDCGV